MGRYGKDAESGWRTGFAGRIEVRESAAGRREWPEAVKGRIVRESLEPGASVKDVAHRHGIAPQQLTTWRRAARQGRLALPGDPVAEDGFGFAALMVAEDPAAAPAVESLTSAPAVEIVADGVVIRLDVIRLDVIRLDVIRLDVIRLDGATPAHRIAEIAAALGGRR